MIKIIADDKIPFLKGVLEPFAEVEYHPGNKITRNIVKDADALIIRTRTKCNKTLLHDTNVKFIATATIGFDHIDTIYCDEENIAWTNAPGCNSSSVQQYIATSLYHLSKKNNFELKDKTLGIVGVGHVGKKVLKIAEDLGLRVVLNDPPRMRNESPCGFLSLDNLIKEADIITFHVPLNMEGEDKTYHLANYDFFQKLLPGTILINSSRGEVVGTDALKNALKTGKLKDAVIDVWENEPEIDTELLKIVSFATPHIAGYSLDGKANGTSMSVNAICNFFKLPYFNWFPENITPVKNNLIQIDCSGKKDETVLLEAIQNTYDIIHDHQSLIRDVDKFEYLRGNYPLRREYKAYEVMLKNSDERTSQLLAEYGFSVK